MTLSETKKFLQACEDAGITTYQFDTDLGTHFYNDSRGIIVIDEAEEEAINIRRKFQMNDQYEGDIRIFVANLVDIHEIRVGGTLDQIKKFLNSRGVTLDEEQTKVLLKINNTNLRLNPPTGDYNNFRYLSDEQLAKLTDEEKEKYETERKKYEDYLEHRGLTQGVAAQITV